MPAALALAAALASGAVRAAEEGEKAGMPQFDTSTFATQVFWLVLTFGSLYLLLWRVALPRVAEVLEARQDRIADDLDKTASLSAEAEDVLAEYEKATAEGRSQAQAALRKAHEAMAAQAAQQYADLSEKLTAEIKAAEARIDAARREATDNIRATASEIAQAAAERLIGRAVDGAAAETAVRKAMED